MRTPEEREINKLLVAVLGVIGALVAAILLALVLSPAGDLANTATPSEHVRPAFEDDKGMVWERLKQALAQRAEIRASRKP